MPIYRNSNITIEPGFALLVAFLLLLLPIKWVISWVLAAAIHELFHCIALLLLNIRIHTVHIGISGARIETEPMPQKHELFSALAGPFGGLSLLIVLRVFPCVAVCALLQSAFNLLPIYPLDGGRALRCFLGGFLTAERAEAVCSFIEYAVLISLLVGAIMLHIFLSAGFLPIVLTVLLFLKSKQVKTSCKHLKQIVQ